MAREIFICHASEDKISVVRPIAAALSAAGISFWVDEAEIKWGDSITQKVNKGFGISKYVIVILSNAFINKNWPQRELYAALNIEAATSITKILPLLVGSESERNEILEQYPLMNDKKYIVWQGNAETIVDEVKSLLSFPDLHKKASDPHNERDFTIPLPRIKKQITQKQKDVFLKESFETIKNYFIKALNKLEAQYKEISTDFDEIHKYKFICKIYVNEETRSQCKIWIGGIGVNSISYYEGFISVDNDSACHDFMMVYDDGYDLFLRPSGMSFMHNVGDTAKSSLTAAEYLWQRFVTPLER